MPDQISANTSYTKFTQCIFEKGHQLYRPMPWRDNTDPYYILVSELMLQQTQVDRVRPKFDAFIATFPTAQSLSQAELSEVLRLWQSLGYNRRARFLHQAAKYVVDNWDGQFHSSVGELQKLPGVGPNTAAAIVVYAFNQPELFVETNIRTVYIHHFFANDFGVDDKQIRELLSQTIDQQNPRRFYWALMDYGSQLKRSGIKNIAQSKHYAKQSKLDGSLRQMRGQILKVLAVEDYPALHELEVDPRYIYALGGLVKDGLVEYDPDGVRLAK